MSMDWAVPTEKKVIQRRQQDIRSKGGRGIGVSKGDLRMQYCTTCRVVFQTSLYDPRRRGISIDIYEDFPTIGKERVDSCLNCESKSE